MPNPIKLEDKEVFWGVLLLFVCVFNKVRIMDLVCLLAQISLKLIFFLYHHNVHKVHEMISEFTLLEQ